MARYGFLAPIKSEFNDNSREKEIAEFFVYQFFKVYGFKEEQKDFYLAEEEGLASVIGIVGKIPESIKAKLSSIRLIRVTEISEDYLNKLGAI